MSTERQRRDLTIDEVIDRATEIAQAQGERGLTMRGVAEACGVTPMALYHHVENKEALLTAIVDRVVAEAIADLGQPDADWRSGLIDFVCRFRQGFIDHPTAGQVFLRRPVLSESLARCTELMFQGFERAGLEGAEVAEATDSFVLLMMGSIANDLSRPPEVRYRLVDHLDPEDSTRLRAELDTYSQRDGEQRLRKSADWLLDGLLADAGLQAPAPEDGSSGDRGSVT